MTIIDYANKAAPRPHIPPVFEGMVMTALSGIKITSLVIMKPPTVTKWQRGLARFGAEGTRHG